MAKQAKKNNNFDLQQLIENPGSYKSLIYGVVTVVVLFIIVFLGIRTLSQNQGDINDDAANVEEQVNANEYEVVAGETLWSISEKVYGTGFNWQLIAEANNVADPNNIEEGTVLVIPSVTPTAGEVAMEDDAMEEQTTPTATTTVAPTQQATPTPTMAQQNNQQANDVEYTVKSGDSLWKIAESQYGDGYKWVDIARANKLLNPNIIHAGNALSIPR